MPALRDARPPPAIRILDLELLLVSERLIVSAQEREGSAGRPLAVMEEMPFQLEPVARLAREVHHCLTFQREASATRTRLEQLGLQLFDLLFGPRIKALVAASRASHLLLRLQSSLLDLPWELLHTGEEFLCLRFAMGRTVKVGDSLRAPLGPGGERAHVRPYRMLILCDPRGDLPHAATEGVQLLRRLSRREEDLSLDLLAAPLVRRQAIEELRRYDFVHFAGHAVASSRGGPSGWLFDDEPFTAADIGQMQGSRAFPWLIFANACLSGDAGGFGDDALPRAFLSAGVRHYIGATSDLPDSTGAKAGECFYQALLEGASVGGALQQARASIAADSGLPSLAWAGYLLYGDPTERYFEPPGAGAMLPPPSAAAGTVGNKRGGIPDDPMRSPPPAVLGEANPPARPVGGEANPPVRPAGGEAGRDDTALPPGSSHSAWRIALSALIGLVLGLLAASGALSGPELVWESGRYALQGQTPWFSSMALLSVRPDTSANLRGLYAELLEQLNAHGVVPRLVAFDTWIAADRRTDQDTRLIEAVAESVERYPVIFGLDTDPVTGAVIRPPQWFEAQLEQVMHRRLRVLCAQRLGVYENDASRKDLKGCEDSLTQTYEARRVLWGDIRIERPRFVFEPFGLRVPLMHRSRREDGANALVYQRPHFAMLVAHPEQGGINASSGQYRSTEDPALAAYDSRGFMPVVLLGKAAWDGDGSFPAWDLEAVLARWRLGGRSGSPAGSASGHPDPAVSSGSIGSTGRSGASGGNIVLPPPSQLNELRILVGAAASSTERKGNEMDQYSTPLGRMFGVEVHANVAESLLRRLEPRPVRAGVSLLGAGLAGGLAAWLGRRRFGRAAVLGAMGLVLASSYALLLMGQVSFPPVAALLAMGVGLYIGRTGRRGAGSMPAALLALMLLTPGRAVAGAPGSALSKGHAPPAAASPTASSAAASPASPASAAPAASPTTSTASASAAAIMLPKPPVAPTPAALEAGWRLVDVKPPDLLARNGLSLSAGSARVGDMLPAGVTLRSSDPTARVLLAYREPGRGIVAHHALWGAFQAGLGANGDLEFASGSVWTRLFRYLEDATGVLNVKYDGTPAGFGSTEVSYEKAGGFGGHRLNVIEGHVKVHRGDVEGVIHEGQGARWSPRPGKARELSKSTMARWTATGTELEYAHLPADQVCAGRLPALVGASLATNACFESIEARDAALASGRASLATGMIPSAWRQLGDAYLSAGQLEQAADSYRRGIKLGGPPAEVAKMQLELGNIRWASGAAGQARAAFEAAVTLDPGLAPAWNNLGVLQWHDGQADQAKSSLQRATDLDPRLVQGWRNLGRVQLERAPADAAQAWQKAGQLTPDDAGVWKDLGMALSASHQLDQAIEAGRRSAALDPAQADLWYRLAKWLWEQGRKAESIEAYQHAEELETKQPAPPLH